MYESVMKNTNWNTKQAYQNTPTNNQPGLNLKQIKRLIGFGFGGLVGVVTACNSIYILETGRVAVIERFGENVRVEEQAGIKFKLPYIEEVVPVDTETIYKYEYGFRTEVEGTTSSAPVYKDMTKEAQVIVEATSNNASIVLTEIVAKVQIDDPIKYLYQVDDINGTFMLALEDVVRTEMQGMTLDQAIISKEEIDRAIMPKLQDKLDKYNSGLRVVDVKTQNIQMLDTVEDERKRVEESKQFKQQKFEEAEQFYNSVIPIAESEATGIVEGAKQHAMDRVAEAKVDVAEFNALYEEYQKNPAVVKEKYYIEAMQEVLSNNTIIYDTTGQNNMLKFYDVKGGNE